MHIIPDATSPDGAEAQDDLAASKRPRHTRALEALREDDFAGRLQDACVIEPFGQAFDAALGLDAIRDFGGDAEQLSALAAHDTTDKCRQSGQVPGDCAGGLAGILLC
jgi:hypothetical protein